MPQGIVVDATGADRLRLAAIAANRNSPPKHVWRGRIFLLTADGLGTAKIMRRTRRSKSVVLPWQKRFIHAGIEGPMRDKTRPSRKPPLDRPLVPRVVELPADNPPAEAPHGTAAAMAKASAVSARRSSASGLAWSAAAPAAPVQALEGPGQRRS
jgi:hypothetical protein